MSDETPNRGIAPSPDHPRRPHLSTFDHQEAPRGLATHSSLVHETLGPFEIHEVIGRGGMGVVLSGMHVGQRVPVAIKVITSPGPIDPRMRRRLRNEVQSVAALNHPGIVMVFDYGDVDTQTALLSEDELAEGTPYFVMELTQRGTLRELAGRLHWHQIKAILLTLLDALAHAHAAGVIHRDIKPENILLGRVGGRLIPKLADFGIAFAVEGGAPTAHCIGTPRYMAPEQINKPWRTHGPWSDLYSLGCVAYELICGRELFEGSDLVKIYQQHFRAHHPRLDPVGTVPPGLQSWMDRMVARDVAERFQSAADAARALVAISDEGIPEVTPPETVSFEFAQLTPVLDPLLQGTFEHHRRADDDVAGSMQVLPENWPAQTIEPMPMRIVGTGLGLYGLRTIPLVGREEELERMWRALREANDDQDSRVMVLHGSQGSGKTRLVESFCQRIKEFGAATVFRATHSAEGGPFDGLAMMLGRHFRTLGSSDKEAETIIRDTMAEVGLDEPHEWQMMTRIVRPALDAEVESAAVKITSPTHRYALIRRYLTRLAQKQPVVVWADDVQWGSDVIEFAQFLRQAQTGQSGPILALLTVTDDAVAERPDEAKLLDGLLEGAAVDELVVEPLDTVEHERLVHELLLLEGDLAREVVRRTAGNPLFAVELIGDWVERGVLEGGEHGFVLRDGVEPSIPDHLHDIWVQRIEALLEDEGEDARDALELAAALGQDVHREEWRGVCDLVGVALDESLAAKLTEQRRARRTETGWAFAHAILRESIERMARDAGRWIAHRRQCATLIETIYDMRQSRVAERFGRYAMGAHEYGRALAPLLEAARGRRRQGEFLVSQQLLSAYLRCLSELDAPESDRRWATAWVARAHAYLNSRQPREASRWARRALEAAEVHDWKDIHIPALSALGLAEQWMGEREATEHLREAYRLIQQIDDVEEMREALVVVTHGLTRLGDFEDAQMLLERDLEVAEKLGDEHAIANNYHMRFRIAFFQQHWQDALRFIEQSVEGFEKIGHLPGKANALEAMAEVYRSMGNLERAEDIYRDCLELQETIGYSTGVAQTNLAMILLHRGRAREAERLFQMAANVFGASGRRMFLTVAHAGLLACAAVEQLWEAVAEHLAPIQAFLDETDACERDLAELLEFGADHLHEAGQFRDAVAVYTLAAQQWQRLAEPDRVEAVMKKISRWT